MRGRADRVVAFLRRALRATAMVSLGTVALLSAVNPAAAQQFNSDNQWVAPHGVATFLLTVGQENSTAMITAALLPETEFNFGLTRFEHSPQKGTEAH